MNAAFSVHNIFGDHMVLQRGRPIRISGVANRGACVRGTLANRSAAAVTDRDGKWVLEFAPMEAGGPYDLTVGTDHWSRTYHDILVGDVWFCSGQSNMEFPVWGENPFFRLMDGEHVAAEANDNQLRLLHVPRAVSPDAECEENPYSPEWRAACGREAVANFSAVAYLFGQELRRRLGNGVPIGLIGSSWGGTYIEAWTPLAALEEAGLSDTLSEYRTCMDAGRQAGGMAGDDGFGEGAYREWIVGKFRKTAPERTAEALAEWPMPGNESAEWTQCDGAPAKYLSKVGAYWLRCRVALPPVAAGHGARLHVDSIDDSDIAWMDGERIGFTEPFHDNYWLEPRDYDFTVRDMPGSVHTVVVRVENHYNVGTFGGGIAITLDDGMVVSLEALGWEVRTEFLADVGKIGFRPDPKLPAAFKYGTPHMTTTLYNAMARPATEMNIKGVIWYQGCNNSASWRQYAPLQKALIDGWRKAWRDPEMPFVITQLAGYWQHAPEARGPEDFWRAQRPDDTIGFASIREVQQSFLDYKWTGVACTIDIGDAYDIHPARKRPLAKRLAHEAMRVAYGDVAAPPGPRGAKAEVSGEDTITIYFRDVVQGLHVDGGRLGEHLVSVKYRNGESNWADAALSDDGLSMSVRAPGAGDVAEVSYAWSAYAPGPFAVRKDDGIPLFPFRLPL